MARETTQLPPGAEATEQTEGTAKKPAAKRGGTATTPTAPLGTKAGPEVEQLAESGGEMSLEIERPAEDLINDTEWLFDQVHHKAGCPMASAPFQGTDDQPGRAQRMDRTDATQPRTQDNPLPRTFRIMRCLDCGQGARVKLPRED